MSNTQKLLIGAIFVLISDHVDAGSLYLDPTRGKVLWVLLFRHLVSTHFVLLGNVVLGILVTRLHYSPFEEIKAGLNCNREVRH